MTMQGMFQYICHPVRFLPLPTFREAHTEITHHLSHLFVTACCAPNVQQRNKHDELDAVFNCVPAVLVLNFRARSFLQTIYCRPLQKETTQRGALLFDKLMFAQFATVCPICYGNGSFADILTSFVALTF
jgi:hypothetical protein